MIKKILSKILYSVILLIAFLPVGLKAQIFDGTTDDTVPDTQIGTDTLKDVLQNTGVTGTDNIGDLILKYVNFALPYLALAAFVGFVYAGFLYVTAYGAEEQVQKAKKILIYAVLGIIVVILSYGIVQLLTQDLVRGIQSSVSSSKQMNTSGTISPQNIPTGNYNNSNSTYGGSIPTAPKAFPNDYKKDTLPPVIPPGGGDPIDYGNNMPSGYGGY